MKNVFLFPGQGAQYQGMGVDFYENSECAKKLIDNMSAICGEDIYSLLKNTPNEELSRSDRSQLAITAVELACAEVLKEKGITPAACAGFSLGEFSALCISGILSFEDTVKLVQKRGQIMQKVCDEISGAGMAAVLGLTPDKVTEAIKDYADVSKPDAVFPTNLNSPKQTVVSGTLEGLKVCEKLCIEAGARRVVPLKVAGPFHSPLMQKAADLFIEELNKVTFNNPAIPCFSNVTGKLFTSGEEAKKNAVLHLIKAVRWTDEEASVVELMANESEWRLVEVGPGQVLTGLWANSGSGDKATCTPVGSVELMTKL